MTLDKSIHNQRKEKKGMVKSKEDLQNHPRSDNKLKALIESQSLHEQGQALIQIAKGLKQERKINEIFQLKQDNFIKNI